MDQIMESVKNVLGENSIEWKRVQKNQLALDELKGWLQQGIVCLEGDNLYNKDIRLDSKISTMKMVLEEIIDLEKNL
jgi:hypothetical protein